MDKNSEINILYKEYNEQFKDEEVVLGDGNLDAQLLLIGEAPGKDEVRLSKPFVGAAGKNLSEFLQILGRGRESIYITNTIKYRLSKINAKTGRVVNRPAVLEEIRSNRSFLLREISIINPEYIVTLGNVPLKAVTGDNKASIGAVHGQELEIIVQGSRYILFPLYHPASIIYNQQLKSTYVNDINKLREILDT